MRLLIFFLTVFAAWAGERDQISQSLRQRTSHELKLSREEKAPLPPGISLDAPLTASEAVAVALWNNAALEADLSILEVARADLVEARSLRDPFVQILFPAGAKRFELMLTAPIELLWQRPKRIKMAESNLRQLAEGLVQNGLTLARDVKLAHTELLLAEDRARIAGEAAALDRRIWELSQRRLGAGDISASDAKLAEVAYRNAAAQAALYDDGRKVTTERLRLLLGLRNTNHEMKATAEAPPSSAPDATVETALASRPDLKSAELNIETARLRAGWERTRLAAFAVALSSKGSGTTPIRSGPALTADLPLLNRNRGPIKRADAEVERALTAYLALKDQVELDLRQARARLLEAMGNLARLRSDVLPAVRETVRLTEKSYASGDVPHLTVIESTRQLPDAELREAEAVAAIRRAWAELEWSVGKSL